MNWKTWKLRNWNAKLFEHFFACTDLDSPPVVNLLVTADELVRVTGDREARPDDVRNSFVDAIRIAIRHSGSLLEDASNYEGWPSLPRLQAIPPFVAHLIFTCLAASESSEELADEQSYIARLRELSGDQLPEGSLHILPKLWVHLSQWLERSLISYRRLRLPEPGSFTRIGYSTKLAFPDRRDQRILSELLDGVGVTGRDLPPGPIVSLVCENRQRFRPDFRSAFDDFRQELEKLGVRGQLLSQHRFWAAVKDASARGRGRERSAHEPTARVSMLAEENDGELFPFLVSDCEVENDAFTCHELDQGYSDWRFVLTRPGESLDPPGMQSAVDDMLASESQSPLCAYIRQGLLPFFAAEHGLLELATRADLEACEHVLALEPLVADLKRLFGVNATASPSRHSGWVQVLGLRIRELERGELETTSLKRVWMLHRSFNVCPIRLKRGIRMDGGWLGVAGFLPVISAPHALTVRLERSDSDPLELAQHDGHWVLPAEDHSGDVQLVCSYPSQEQRRLRITFFSAALNENYKRCSDPSIWIIEALCGTDTLADPCWYGERGDEIDYAYLVNQTICLGDDVGEFLPSDTPNAPWQITKFGGRWIGSRGKGHADAPTAKVQVSCANSRRRWRRLIIDSKSPAADQRFLRAQSHVKRSAPTHILLPKIEATETAPSLDELRLATPSPNVNRAVQIFASLANLRAGTDLHHWSGILSELMGVKEGLLRHVCRAWVEAGLVDIVSSSRWRTRKALARRPALIGFLAGDYVGASVTGLLLPSTLHFIESQAEKGGGLVERKASASEFVPDSLSIRLGSKDLLFEIGRACNLPVEFLDLRGVNAAPRHNGTANHPTGYELLRSYIGRSLNGESLAPALMQRYVRKDRPDYWVVSSETNSVWSYELNIARLWASVFCQRAPLIGQGDSIIEAVHAYLPLPLARLASVLGKGLAGPSRSGAYQYPVGSRSLQQFILHRLSDSFDMSRLNEITRNQASG